MLPRERLLAEVWGWADASGTRTVDSHVKALRRKLGRRPDPHRARRRLRPGRRAAIGEAALDRRLASPDLPARPGADAHRLARDAGRRPLPRPLDVRSIKMKLGMLLVGSGGAGLSYFWSASAGSAGAPSIIAIGRRAAHLADPGARHDPPLREMTAAARAMARGDYTRRVRATSRDEVGELAQAFNQMAADLAAADQQRRELIANVSHELRTPITALQGVLENIVDGVAEPDPATLRTALAQTERLGRLVTELLDLSRHRRRRRAAATADRVRRRQFLDEVVAEAEVTAGGARPRRRVSVACTRRRTRPWSATATG